MSTVDSIPEDTAGWPSRNYDNPSRRGLELVVVELVVIALVFVTVSLRVYSKSFLSKFFGLEDWLIFLATIFCIGLTTTSCLATFHYGWGMHIYDLPTPTVENSLKLLWVSELFFTWSLCFTKLSICVFYLRLLTTGFCRRIIYISIAVVALWAFGFSVGIIAQCSPVRAAWRASHLPGERCADIKARVIAHAVVDIATNLVLWALPARLMLGLGLRGKQRVLVLGLFVLGGIVCAAAVIRLPYTIRSMQNPDTTWYVNDSYIWTTLEASLAIICVSLPSLTPILAKLMPKLYHNNEYDDQSHFSHSRCSIAKGSSFGGGELTLMGSAFPLAHISTTAISNKGCTAGGGGGCSWFHWPMGGVSGGGGISSERKAPNESEENIVIGSNDTLAGGMGITKTTVIEQSVSVGIEIERRSPSPKLVGRVTF